MKPATYDYLSEGRQLIDRREYDKAATMLGIFLQHVPDEDVNSQYEALRYQATCYERTGDEKMAQISRSLADELEEEVDSASSSRLRVEDLLGKRKRA